MKKQCAIPPHLLTLAILTCAALTFSHPARAASTLFVNPNGVCGGNSPCFTTIQAAINAATAGDTIQVAAATYAEPININKALTLLGPNANINPNTGARGAEAVIIPTASDPLNPGFAGPIGVYLSATGTTFRGFTVDGNNPSLTSGVVFNGADVDAEFGVYGDGSANLNAVVENNIVQNIGEIAVWLNTFGLGGARNANTRITTNKVDNVLGNFGQAIRISDDAWADVTQNVVTRSRVGIDINNYSGNVTTHPASQIADNQVTAFRIGIRHELHYVYNAPGFTITRNTVSAYVQSPLPPQVTTPTAYQGIRVESIQQTVAVDVTDNFVDGNRAALQGAGYTRVEGLHVTNASATSPNIRFTLNHVTDNIRGVFHETPAVPTLSCNSIVGNTSGIVVDAAASNGLVANYNNIVGNPTIGVQNNSAASVNAQANWWGAASGPGPVGPGSGDGVSTNVDFSNWQTAIPNCGSLVVTTTADTTADDGATSLREAIRYANTKPNAAANTPDEITFDIPGPGPHMIQLGSALPDLMTALNLHNLSGESITVRGEGAADPYRIFTIGDAQTIGISNLTISNGKATQGGGLYNHGTLTLTNCTVSGNSADDAGGGIFSEGIATSTTLNLNASTVSGNSAGAAGGGIFNSCVSGGNSATTNLTNSTISGNSAVAEGGGLMNEGYTGGLGISNIANCTFSSNTAPSGGGIYNEANSGTATVNLSNTILKQGASGENIANNVSPTVGATINSQGHNLSDDAAGGDGSSAPGGELDGTGDQRNTDPKLGALTNNGGPTQTHALLSGSPAINGGDDDVLGAPLNLTTDQRSSGHARKIGSAVDIGAYESNFAGDAGAIVVTVTEDTDDGNYAANDISLREAINFANAHPNGATPDTIGFAIGSGVATISPTAGLPAISEAVVIDGTTQPGTTDHPLVQLDGTSVGAGNDGLTLQSGNSTLRGLAIGHFGGAGVRLAGSGGHHVESCYIGTFYNGPAASNQTAAANATGVFILASGNVVGLALDGSGAGNRIWTNSGDGVQVSGDAQSNVIRGNTFRDNGEQAIDLNGDGPTLNDPDAANDGDQGGNDVQNFPVLSSVVLGFNKTNTTVNGTLHSKLDRDYRLDFYRSSSTAGVAQPGWIGTFYLGSKLVHSSAAAGTASFSFNVGAPLTGVFYGATATDLVTGDTSEFSPVSFQDGTKPAISLTAPNPAGGVLTVGADFPQIQGTATDNLPGVTVRLHLRRLSDGLYWDGTGWGAPPTQLPTSPPSGATGTWHSTGNLPKPAPTDPVTLADNKYQIVAYAIDVAGNQSVAAKTLSYDLQKPTVTISTPGTAGQASNSLVNVANLTGGISGTSAHPGVGIKKVLLKLTRNADNFQWNGSAWVAGGGAAQYVTVVLDNPVGSSPAAWHASGALPPVNGNATNGLEVGKVYNLSAVAYDTLDQASTAFLLRIKIVSVLSVSQAAVSQAPASE